MRVSLKKLWGLLYLVVCSNILLAQIVIDNNVTGDALAGSIMAPANIVVPGSVILNCPTGAFGAFSNGISDGLGIDNGIMLTTGQTSIFEQDNTAGGSGINNNVTGFVDTDLQAIEPLATFDGCVIEFDIEPICEELILDYIWGSDEYPEYVNGGYNDAFGFFVSGPGITGTVNIATVPGTTTLVSIDNVNSGSNAAYYVDNTGGNKIEYDGYTKDLSARIQVVPCETYHLKIVCADAGDGIYDSGVLVAVNNPPCPINQITWTGIDTIGIENCKDLNFGLNRTGEIGDPLDVTFEVLGTATDGVDYTFGLTDHTFLANDSIDAFNIPILTDAILEGQETIQIIATIYNCSAEVKDTITLIIKDNMTSDMASIPETCIGMCDGSASVTPDGIAPYTYSWNNSGAVASVINLCAGDHIVTITDAEGCVIKDTVTVSSGNASSSIIISAVQDTFCLNDSGIQLTSNTTGGIWIGNGIDGTGNFSPSSAGTGDHFLEYQIAGACGDTATYTLIVNPLQDATITTGFKALFCIEDIAYTFTSVNSEGIWSGNGINPNTGDFDPKTAGVGIHNIVYHIANPCEDFDTIEVEVVPLIVPIISSAQDTFCLNNPAITLATTETGGTWIGSGMDPLTGEFDPLIATAGNHEIIYELTSFCSVNDFST